MRATPPAELALLFLLCGTEARRAEVRTQTLGVLARANFRALERELAERRLLPLIGSRAIEAGGERAPGEFREAVARARATARARALALEAAAKQLESPLSGAGVRVLPLKGPWLAAAAHGDPGLRETADLDLLVSARDLDRAVRALRAEGFSGPDEKPLADGLPDLHFTLRRDGLPAVELHWRVHWYERDFADEMLARARPGPDGLLRAAPDDLAASLLLFYARDGFHGVRHAADIAAWCDRHRADLPAAFLEGHARRYPALAPALAAAAAAAEWTTGAPAREWLGAEARLTPSAAAAVRLADWAQWQDRDQLAANVSLVGGLLGARGFLRRELLPAGAGMRATTAHAAKMCARYGAALWSVRGGRRLLDAPLGAPR